MRFDPVFLPLYTRLRELGRRARQQNHLLAFSPFHCVAQWTLEVVEAVGRRNRTVKHTFGGQANRLADQRVALSLQHSWHPIGEPEAFDRNECRVLKAPS